MRRPLTPALCGVLVSLFLTACGEGDAPAAPPPPAVTVSAPLSEQVVDWDDFVGRFEAPARVDVRARAGGYIQAAHFREGQYVRRGQTLFTLDPRTAEAQLAAARAQANLARGELNRAQGLLAEQAISREEFESRRAAALVADAAVRARALDVEFTRVTAPISGVVSDRKVDPGNLVAGGTSAGDVLTTIVATSPIHFTFEAPESLLLKYQRQDRRGVRTAIQVRLQDEADYRWTGLVDFTDNTIDPGTGAVRLRATIANPGGFLKPGMFGHARMQGSGAYTALLIPDSAVVADGPRKVAYVVGGDGTVTARPLQLGPLSGGLRVVRTGLRPTDRVIINGVQRARPGQKVQATTGRITRAAGPAGEAPTISAPPASASTPVGG
ncbi:MAG TPA: efflux RND transporter periplasmic adaptor subunit [Caulobacteraceae bacterium]|nr:efflux RND transporter periplasmic adaptor subunit [Caulobacteraceae bacterium]